MKVRIELHERRYGRGFKVVILPVEYEDDERLKRKLNYIYKKHGWECLIAELENIRVPDEA